MVIKTYKTDKYARYLADIFYRPGETDAVKIAGKGLYLNAVMVQEGQARRWHN